MLSNPLYNLSRGDRIFLAAMMLLLPMMPQPAWAGPAGAPFPNDVPWTWVVVQDGIIREAEVEAISEKLGGKVAGLRNTRFAVAPGKTVQINAIRAATNAEADAVYASLLRMKPAEYLVRHGRVVFEFVGKNDAIPLMREAAARLRRSPPLE